MKNISKKDIRNIVIKVGTSVLTERGKFDKAIIGRLAAEVSALRKKGLQVAIVSSGAIGAGMTILKEKKRPKTMEGLQAAAAVGQRYLMQCYEEAFSRHGFSTAQVLLTWDDMTDRKRFTNAKHTLKEIQRRQLIPIINENDTVATDEIRFGDNDMLSSLISILLETDLLIILSDTDGLYTGGHKTGKRLALVKKMDSKIFAYAKDRETDTTRGGMSSKLKAVKKCVTSGIPVFLADGRQPGVLRRLFADEDIGTRFLPSAKKSRARKNWIAHFINHVQGAKQ